MKSPHMTDNTMYRRVMKRAGHLGPFMPSMFHTFFYLAKAKFNKRAIGRGNYKGMEFAFTPKDMSAIWEVLGEKEYGFLSPILRSTARPLILDVGAHIGLFGIWVLNENPESQILSVEPSPETFKTLVANARSASGDGRWNTVHAAGWSDDSALSFATQGDSMGHRVSSGVGACKVPGITLDSLVDMISGGDKDIRINLLKIDIEGSEEVFLNAGEDNLGRIDCVVIELHPKLCDAQKVRDILSRHYKHISSHADETQRKPLLLCRN